MCKKGKVIGIVLKHLTAKNILSYTLGNELRVLSMHEKIGSMLYNTNAFIALPGGLETLEEVFDMAS